MELKKGWMAKSLAGNDRGRLYTVEQDAGTYVFLTDDTGKQIRKNKKQIQAVKRMKETYTSYRRK